jgi:GT2 family glycosyltransferase
MTKRKNARNAFQIKNKTIRQGNFDLHSKLVDIIIPVYRRFDLLSQCLESIPKAFGEISYRIIIFDNGSPIEAADDFYAKLPSSIKVIRNKENIGFPKACNIAFNHGYSPLVFFLNDDVILNEGSGEILVRAMDDPNVGVAGMKLLFPEKSDLDQRFRPPGKIQHIGLATTINADVIHQFLGWSPDNPKVNQIRDVIAVTGAALLTRRSLFNKAGKFLEAYGMGTYEDVDLCLSIKSLGYNIIVVPEAVGIHYTNATSVTYNIGYSLNENKMIFLQRWLNQLEWTEWWYG